MSILRARLEVARDVVRDALARFSGKGARFLAAAIAFYALLSAAPLLVVVVHVVGAVVGRERAEGALLSGLATWIAPEGMAAIERLAHDLEAARASEGLAGGALLIYGSTRLFRGLRRALNQLWGVDLEAVERARPRAERYARRYGLALLLMGLVVLLVGALVLVKGAWAALGAVGGGALVRLLWGADLVSSVLFAFVLFFALFKLLPETRVAWPEAAWGALVSTALFAVGSELVTLYLGHKRLGDLYGGAATVVVAIFWVYYSAQTLFLGACVGIAIHAKRSPS
jgi:membrane protein